MMLKDRILNVTGHGRARTVSISSSTSSSTSDYFSYRPSKYKDWTEEQMRAAYEAVKDGMSIRRAAEEYGVPKSTLGDRVSGRSQMGCKGGPHKILTDEQEECLVGFLVRCATIGYAKSRIEVMALIDQIYKSRGIDKSVTNGWWESFCKRHPNLTLRAASSLSKARTIASDPSFLSQYFDILEETLREYGLIEKPNMIFNMDETGMPFDSKPLKTIFSRGENHAHVFSSGSKEQLTVVGCVNAVGFCMPPMVVVKSLPPSLAKALAEGEVPGTIYGLSPNGWMDMELFHLWFIKHFLKYIPACRPVLLLMDGHRSHYNPETIKLAAGASDFVYTSP